mmetsp:Transcript_7694/g.11653  ORF Transcript_7694/g.11653 Transcript_7694/m.11653 type:complete len:132 (+) Transcript_7694:193-588(+)
MGVQREKGNTTTKRLYDLVSFTKNFAMNTALMHLCKYVQRIRPKRTPDFFDTERRRGYCNGVDTSTSEASLYILRVGSRLLCARVFKMFMVLYISGRVLQEKLLRFPKRDSSLPWEGLLKTVQSKWEMGLL